MSRFVRYFFRLVLRLLMFLIGALAVGCLVPQSCDRGISCKNTETVYFVNHGYHSSLALPAVSIVHDWRKDFPYITDSISLVEFGWGEKAFYMSRSFPIGDGVKALFLPNPSVLQVVALEDRNSYILSKAEIIPIELCRDQYAEMVTYIRASFQRDSLGKAAFLAEGFYPNASGFYDALGTYYAFNNCNTWVGGALRAASLQTPLWDGIPQSIRWHLSGKPIPRTQQ